MLGDPAEPTLAAQLAGLVGDAASHAADALAEAVIFAPGRLAFVHPLVRASVYSELSSQERARLHEHAARLLTAAGAATDRIAVHLLATNPGGDAETVNTLRQAASDATRRGAPDVAFTYLRRALAEPPSSEVGPVLVHDLGRAALSAGDLRMAIEQLRQATRLRGSAAARGSGKRARVGALPRGSAGRGDGRSHRGHRRVTRERARGGTAPTGDALGGREGQRCGLASSPGN